MKILIATDHYLPFIGGITSHICGITDQLVKTGNEVYIIAPSSCRKDKINRKKKFVLYEISSLPTFIIPDIRFVPPFQSNKISKIIEEINPDVIHVHTGFVIGNTVSKLAKKYGIPQVGTNHFMLENFFDNIPNPIFFKKMFERFIWKMWTKHLNNTDLITTPTPVAVQYLKQKFKRNVIIPISNGINFGKFNNHEVDKNVLHEYGIPEENKLIVFTGRLVKEKRVDILIRSLSRVIKKGKITLVIVGRGNYLVNFMNLAKQLALDKNIIFTGYLKDGDLIDLYKSSDLFIMPSIAELQSIATLEAMASGLPVVAANAVALPELVKDGLNGYLFEPGNSKMLAEKIEKILFTKGLAKKMGKESVKISQKHDINLVVLQFEAVYQKAIAINAIKQKEIQIAPFYLTRRFAIRMAFALFILGILFRNLLVSPTTAKAKTIALKNKIMNSKLVMKIENIDLNLKTQLPKSFIKKTN